MLYICTKLAKLSQRVSEIQTRTIGSTLGWSQMYADEHTDGRKIGSLYRAMPEAGATKRCCQSNILKDA